MTRTVRLAPEDRKTQILDAIASAIEQGHIGDLSIELITREAGVSKALIYKYYPSISAMLEELLEREHVQALDALTEKLETANNFAEVLHVLVNQNFNETVDNSALNTLKNHPGLQATRKRIALQEGRSVIPVLNRVLKGMYDIDDDLSGQIMEIGSGASYAAARFYLRKGGNRNQHVEAAVQYIQSGTQALLDLKQRDARGVE